MEHQPQRWSSEARIEEIHALYRGGNQTEIDFDFYKEKYPSTTLRLAEDATEIPDELQEIPNIIVYSLQSIYMLCGKGDEMKMYIAMTSVADYRPSMTFFQFMIAVADKSRLKLVYGLITTPIQTASQLKQLNETRANSSSSSTFKWLTWPARDKTMATFADLCFDKHVYVDMESFKFCSEKGYKPNLKHIGNEQYFRIIYAALACPANYKSKEKDSNQAEEDTILRLFQIELSNHKWRTEYLEKAMLRRFVEYKKESKSWFKKTHQEFHDGEYKKLVESNIVRETFYILQKHANAFKNNQNYYKYYNTCRYIMYLITNIASLFDPFFPKYDGDFLADPP